MHQLNPQQLKGRLSDRDSAPLLLDVREPWEYELCHLSGSLHIPMGQIPTSLEALDSDREIVVICHHGVRSLQVCIYLQRMGFSVINLSGGIDAWAQLIDPEMATY